MLAGSLSRIQIFTSAVLRASAEALALVFFGPENYICGA